MVVTTLDTCTSLLSGTIIFGILGNLAFKMNQPVTSVVKSGGTGLAFISYPEAIARFESVPWVILGENNISILIFNFLIVAFLNFVLSHVNNFGNWQSCSSSRLCLHCDNGRISLFKNLARFIRNWNFRIYYRISLHYSCK